MMPCVFVCLCRDDIHTNEPASSLIIIGNRALLCKIKHHTQRRLFSASDDDDDVDDDDDRPRERRAAQEIMSWTVRPTTCPDRRLARLRHNQWARTSLKRRYDWSSVLMVGWVEAWGVLGGNEGFQAHSWGWDRLRLVLMLSEEVKRTYNVPI